MENIKTTLMSLKKNRIVMTIFGILLFYIIGEFFGIDTGVQDIFIYLQYPILYIFAAVYGAVPGLLIGLIGHFLVDFGRGDIWLSWITASGLIGFLIGFVYEKTDIKKKDISEKRRLLEFFGICVGGAFAVFGIYAGLMNVIFYKVDPALAFKQSMFAALSDGITTLIVVDILFYSFKNARIRRLVAFIVLLNSLILLSYGNRGLGSLIVYGFTCIMCLVSFFHTLVDYLISKGKLRFLWTIAIVVLLGIGTAFWFLMVSGHVNNPKGDEKVMIVLGAGLNDREPNKILAKRLDKAIDFANKYPDVIIVTSGGQGSDEVIPEALAMKEYIVGHGIDESRIIMEDRSSTTEENFRFSLETIKSYGLDENDSMIIVTNDFHCLRSERYAHDEGFENTRTLAASTPVAMILPNYIRELMAWGKYIIRQYM